MQVIVKKLKHILISVVILILAIWLSPLILLGGIVYLMYRIRKYILRRKLITQVKQEWFSRGKHVLFLYSDSQKWKSYFEQELIPQIAEQAIVWNWSRKHEHGWNENLLEAKLVTLFRPRGYLYPTAIVFMPSGEVKTFQFYESYVDMLKSGQTGYKEMEKDFLTLVSLLKKQSNTSNREKVA